MRALGLIALLTAACQAGAGKAPLDEDEIDSADAKADWFRTHLDERDAIASGDARTFDVDATPRYRSFLFQVPAGGMNLVASVSGQDGGDPVAWLLDARYAVVAENDDADPSTTDSVLAVAALPEGTYHIVVRERQRRAATLRVTVVAGADEDDPDARLLAAGLINGGFEGSLSSWTLGGTKLPIVSTAHVHSGSSSLRCGATTGSGVTEPDGDSFAYQAIAIPATASKATLSFWYYAATTDSIQYDWQDAQIRDSGGNVLLSIFHMADNSQTWKQQVVDLTAFKGRTVQIYFNAHGDGYTDPTTLWVDDVVFTVTDGGGDPALQNGVPVTGLAGARGSTTYFQLRVPAGAANLVFRLGTGTSSTNDADLFVRRGSRPTTSTYDCHSEAVGLTDACGPPTIAADTYYVLVYGYTAYSGASLVASYTISGTGASISVHTTLGLPDHATTSDPQHYLSVKPQYVISYNSSRKTPNWSSWELNSSYLGSTPRQDTFRVDDTLPAGMPQAQLADFVGSGFDRGHLCPSADRTLTVTDNSATFYLTNMVPQAPNNNRGPWEKLEAYSRTLVGSGKELFIVAGGVYSGTPRTVGAGAVQVPSSTFKVIVVLDRPGQGATDVTAGTRVIAVDMPNDNTQIGLGDDWLPYRVSVRQIEAETGFDLLSDVPREVQDVVETRVDSL
jgi:endonuclease G, mitochondrial